MKTKIPFGRTPKIQGRTSAPAVYIAAEYVLVFHWFIGAGFDMAAERWLHALFAAMNALLLGYGIVFMLGLKESLQDIRAQWRLKLPSQLPAIPALSRTGVTLSGEQRTDASGREPGRRRA